MRPLPRLLRYAPKAREGTLKLHFYLESIIFFATVLWLVLHRLHGAVRTTAFTRIAIVLYALEILKDTYAYPYGAEAYSCNNYNLL